MKMNYYNKYCTTVLCLVFLCLCGDIWAQVDTTSRSKVIVLNANSQLIDTRQDTVLNLNGDVVLAHDSLFMYCDTARLVNNNVVAWGNVILMKSDSLKLFSDSLRYDGDSLEAYFYRDVVLEEGNNQLFTDYIFYDVDKDIGMYTDTALLKSLDYELKSRRGYYYAAARYVDFYDDVEVIGDQFNLISDSLRYYTDLNKAVFRSPTNIVNKDQRIYSHSGYYHLDSNSSLLYGNAQYQDESTKAKADTIKYHGDVEEVELIGHAKVDRNEDRASANYIKYAKPSDELNMKGNARYKGSEETVEGEEIRYYGKTEDLIVEGTGFFSNPPYLIRSENIRYVEATGAVLLDDNVFVQDTAKNVFLEAQHIIFNDQEEYFKAYNSEGKALMGRRMDADTLYISADTLYSYKQYIEEDTISIFEAYNDVEILSSDISGVADSLSYIETDSLLQLFQSPKMWGDSSQFSADTIVLTMKDDNIDDIALRNNALIINTKDFKFFNQVSGTNGLITMKQDTIKRFDIYENVHSVYYLQDEEDGYIGVNKSKAKDMIMTFEDGEIRYIKYIKETEHELLPMESTDHDAVRVSGFIWLYSDRPVRLEDLK